MEKITDSLTAELIVVKQLPVIEERLRSMKESVDRRVANALALVCTEDTVQAVKAERAKLNQEFALLEEQRKAAKKAVLGPYERFESIYRECISDTFREADTKLKGKIGDVEFEIKRRCEEGLRDYFAELCAVYHLDWLTYDRAGIKVDMASAKAKTPQKLRKQLAEFVTSVAESVDRINAMDDSGEVMVEFKRSLNAADAVYTVQERHRRVEQEQAEKEARKAVREREVEAVRRVEALAPPVQTQQAKIVKCTFTVHTTMDKLKKLKEFMNMEGIKYE